MADKIIKHRGKLFAESNGQRRFLCSMSPKLSAIIESANDYPIPELNLNDAIPKLSKGLCPLCESRLRVADIGRYDCSICNKTFVNTEGYRLPILMADEIIIGSINGHTIQELTTAGVPPVMPSPLKTRKDKDTYFGICPQCYSALNQRGECSKCGWSPTDVDKLWEQVTRIVERVVSIYSSSDKTIQFEFGEDLCKIVLEETEEGHKYVGRYVNVTSDRIDEIIGRPKAVINFIVDKLGLQPVRQVNNIHVNSPIQETGYRLPIRSSGGHIGKGNNGTTINKNRR